MLGLTAFLFALPLVAGTLTVPGTVHEGDLFILRQQGVGPRPAVVEFMGQKYSPLRPEGGESPFFLLAVDLQTPAGSYPLTVRYRDGEAETLAVEVKEGDFPVERLTLPTGMVTPPPEVLDRIARERKAAAAVYGDTSPEASWAPPFVRPTDGKPSGNFGRRRILNGKPKSPHSGEDYSAPRGREVRATARGRVRMAEDLYYSGLTVLIDHGAGLVSQYFHLDAVGVEAGQMVEAGQPIGKVGATGRVTGPHLHFGVRLHGRRADPSQLWELFPN